jgi:hypothetical protein
MVPESENVEVPNQGVHPFRPGAIAAGVILLVVGAAMFLGARSGLDVRFGRLIGPLALIAIGASMVLERSALVIGQRERKLDRRQYRRLRRGGGAATGVWMICIGCWMAVVQSHIFGLTYHNSWPLLIVLSGIFMVIRGFK